MSINVLNIVMELNPLVHLIIKRLENLSVILSIGIYYWNADAVQQLTNNTLYLLTELT